MLGFRVVLVIFSRIKVARTPAEILQGYTALQQHEFIDRMRLISGPARLSNHTVQVQSNASGLYDRNKSAVGTIVVKHLSWLSRQSAQWESCFPRIARKRIDSYVSVT